MQRPYMSDNPIMEASDNMPSSQSTENQNPSSIDESRLAAFLKQRIPGLAGEMVLEQIGGGQSNPTFFVTFDNRRLVLRKRPHGNLLPSAHAIDREYRVLAALRDTDVAVPDVIFYHEDPTLIGTSFYVMERIDGRVYHNSALQDVPLAERRVMYDALADMLAAIHRVDYSAVGLDGYGKVGGFVERQFNRWCRQWELSRTRDVPAIDRLIEWLPKHMPKSDVTTLVHGDFRIGNVMFHPVEPRIVGVLDWELSTLGDPMADLAHTCVYTWLFKASEYGGGLRDVDLDALQLPSLNDFTERYAAAAARAGTMPEFYLAFALFRNAVIFEGIADRARQGNAAAEDAKSVGDLAPALAERGAELIGA